jgi:serine/threonine-protein kinase HipA
MAFNVVGRNQDDHVKNIAFLMDKRGAWSLAPAFDVTYSYNPTGRWTSRHQMSMNGKRDGFTRADFRECGTTVSLKRGRADAILDEVLDAVGRWVYFADAAGVSAAARDAIAATHRRDLRA